jgi:hypothetical protein
MFCENKQLRAQAKDATIVVLHALQEMYVRAERDRIHAVIQALWGIGQILIRKSAQAEN